MHPNDWHLFDDEVTHGSDARAKETDDYFALMDSEDYRHATGPRKWAAEPCMWCGRRCGHPLDKFQTNDKGEEQLVQMHCLETEPPVLPFGKYRGKSLAEVPEDYLQWLVEKQIGDTEWRSDLERWLEVMASTPKL